MESGAAGHFDTNDGPAVRYERDDRGVARLTLDRPEVRNAFTEELLDGLIDALQRARSDDAVRCVVIQSSHPTTYSSGGDLNGFRSDQALMVKHASNARYPFLIRLIADLGKPTICAARGHVLAGALGLALACDLVICSDTATFGTPEINVGAFPFMVTALLCRNIGLKKATELLLTGRRVSAVEAERMGLVNCVVPSDDFDHAVASWADDLAAKSPLLMRLGKEAIRRQQDMGFDDALEFLRSQLTLAFASEDLKEGVGAFFEGRAPVWKGQ